MLRIVIAYIKLWLFNKRTNNKIFSIRCSLDSIKFSNIEVQEHSIIDSRSSIGANSYIGHNCCITRSEIGSFCSIANMVSIGNGEHDINKISTSSLFYEDPYNDLTAGETKLGNDVWVGVGAIIRRGVTIGNGAVVGANSFVNRDIPPYAVVAGSPAKIIKYRFTKDIINKIDGSQWFSLPLDEAKIKIENLKRELFKDNANFTNL